MGSQGLPSAPKALPEAYRGPYKGLLGLPEGFSRPFISLLKALKYLLNAFEGFLKFLQRLFKGILKAFERRFEGQVVLKNSQMLVLKALKRPSKGV